MSLWLYLNEWFMDVPTLGTLVRRCLVLVAASTALLFTFAALAVPSGFAMLVQPASIVLGVFLVRRYLHQRSSR